MNVFERFGFRSNPYATTPISHDTLNLFVGRKKEVHRCLSMLGSKSVIVIEGGRGVGTTSLGNYARFTLRRNGECFTPENEISVSSGWNQEFLLANVISWLINSLDKDEKTAKDKRFLEIKRATHTVQEVYRDVGIQLAGMGAEYSRKSIVTIPPRYPIATLTQYLQKISDFIEELGYAKETIVQINNLDIGTTIPPDFLKFFLNEIRDILQIPGYSWLLVGDSGLKGFIASNIDRVDDIITTDVYIPPLTLDEVYDIIEKRVEHLRLKERAVPPVTDEVIDLLYTSSNGRIRQIFGIATRLLSLIADDPMIDKIDHKVAVPLIETLVEEKISQHNLHKSPSVVNILRQLVEFAPITTTRFTKKIGTSQPQVSRALTTLQNARLAYMERKGREHIWIPMPDVKIAMTKGNTLGRA